MISASRSVASLRASAKSSVEPLPHLNDLQDLYQMGVKLRRGQLIMVYGQPGSQKTGFVLWLIDQWNLPTLYFSADSSDATMVPRLAGLRTNTTSDEVLVALHDGGGQAAFIEDDLTGSKISFVYEDAPAFEDIEAELDAWVELYDEWPAILVVDNLIDVDSGDGGEDWQGWRLSLLWLKGLVRKTGITVIVTHHASESNTDPDWPSPRKAIQGKISQTPEVILSVALTPAGEFRVAPVKTRDGTSEPQARRGIELLAAPAKTRFSRKGRFVAPEKKRGSWSG